jgi:enoyl-CoA hydratase
MIFVADNAQIGFPSIPAGAGYVSAFWNWMVGPHRTKYLAFLPGSRISGKEAESMGFAMRAFPAETLEQESYSYAQRVARVPAQNSGAAPSSGMRKNDQNAELMEVLRPPRGEALSELTKR